MNVKKIEEPIVSSLGGVVLKVENLQKMAEWYGELLSMPVPQIDSKMPFFIFDMDNRVNLILDDYRNMPQLKKFPICQMKIADIDHAYSLVKESGMTITLEVQRPHPGLAYFNLEDTEGNILQIVESDWVNPNSVQPVNSDHPIKNHLNSCVFPVKNLKRATEWYSKLLGSPIKAARQDSGPIYWFDLEEGTGILLDDNRNNPDADKFPTFMLRVSNIHESYEFVKNNGIDIKQDIQFDHFFRIKDPEGNRIILCE